MAFPKPEFKARYENFINGEWTPPVGGAYFANPSPVDGADFCEIPRSKAEDIELAIDAAEAAFPAWSKTAVAERSGILLKIADRIEQNLESLAAVETWDNGKSISTMATTTLMLLSSWMPLPMPVRAEAM